MKNQQWVWAGMEGRGWGCPLFGEQQWGPALSSLNELGRDWDQISDLWSSCSPCNLSLCLCVLNSSKICSMITIWTFFHFHVLILCVCVLPVCRESASECSLRARIRPLTSGQLHGGCHRGSVSNLQIWRPGQSHALLLLLDQYGSAGFAKCFSVASLLQVLFVCSGYVGCFPQKAGSEWLMSHGLVPMCDW